MKEVQPKCWGVPACKSCPSDYKVTGTPRFDDMAIHCKVECNVCGTVFWQVFDWAFNVYDRSKCSLLLEV